MSQSFRWLLRNILMVAALAALGLASVLHVRWHPIAIGRPPAALKIPTPAKLADHLRRWRPRPLLGLAGDHVRGH